MRLGSVGIQAGRCLNLLRYHRPSQLWHRVVIRLRRRWFSVARARSFVNIAAALPLTHEPAFDLVVRARCDCRQRSGVSKSDWSQGQFVFLGQDCDLGSPVDWTLETHAMDHLWRFHLHYQDYLLDALEADESHTTEDAWRVILDWIDHYPITAPRATTDGWHPFCISKRLLNWIVLHCYQPPVVRVDEILGSMVSQTRFLSRNLETDIGGNHLLENIRALGMAGAFFMGNESDLWLRQADRLLRRELPRQFLPHGEHFERSPMYHAHMLEVLLDLRDVTHQRAPDISKLCNEYSVRAAEFLATILHTDGEIPLFADSVLSDAPPSQVLLARADCGVDHIIPDVRADGGYWTFRDKDLFVVFDAAPAGADHLPAHAHADLLTFELSYCARRLFVDTGVHDYADSDMRRYCRGTAAHNVVQIDDWDQFDMWSRFRVGYRGWPAKLRHAEENGIWWAYATHNAYRRVKVPVIGRWIACGRSFIWTCVDWASGDGKHQLTNRLHLHPDAKADVCGDTTVRISLSGVVPLYLHCLAVGRVELTKSWYCPHFGQRQEAIAIEVVMTETLPAAMGWYLSDMESCPAKLSMTEAGWRFSIEDASPIRSWAYDMNQQIVRAE